MTCANHPMDRPSAWVQRFAMQIRKEGEVLDLACGGGRHARWLAGEGWRVEAVDRDSAALAGLAGVAGITVRVADLEHGAWPYVGRRFAGIAARGNICQALDDRNNGASAIHGRSGNLCCCRCASAFS